MTFLNAILLGGAASIAIPILLELLNRTRIQKVPWAAMQFLKNSVLKNQKKLRIQDLLLLLIRCLILALLAFALARPILPSANFLGLSGTNAVLLVDNSYSMGLSDGGETRLARARAAAESILDALPSGSEAALHLVADDIDAVIPLPTPDLALVRSRLRSFAGSDQATSLAGPYQNALEMLESSAPAGEIYILTDGQNIGFSNFGQMLNTLEGAKNRYPTTFVFLGQGTEPNLAVSNLRPDAEIITTARPLRVEVALTNHGLTPFRDVPVNLSVNDEPPRVQEIVPLVEAGTTTTVTLEVRLREGGLHTLTASVPDDRLPADNRRSLAIEVNEAVDVLVVEGNPGERLLESSAFFLTNALQPVPAAQRPAFFLQARTVAASAFRATDLANADVVFLSEVSALPRSLVASLADFVATGGGLVVFPGAQLDAGFYNGQLHDEWGLLPARLGSPAESEDNLRNFQALQTDNFEHPIPSLFSERESGSLGLARFYNHRPLIEEAWPLDASSRFNEQARANAGPPAAVLRFEDGSPAVMERRWGQGRVIAFSSTASTRWNDFPLRAVYLPFVHRTVGYLLQRQGERLNLSVGQPLVVNLDDRLLNREARIRQLDTPNVDGVTPQATLELAGGRVQLRTDKLRQAGAYEARINAQPKTVLRFAVQPDTVESSPQLLPDAQKETLARSARVIHWSDDLDLAARVTAERTGAELSAWFIYAVLLLVIAETILAQRFSRSR
ncbi:MAG: BatA domain-containing protein [Opitutales bacterium]